MLSPQEAFRIGFLLKCAEDGMTGEQIRERIDGVADKLTKNANLLDSALGGAGAAATYGMGGLALAPILAGGLGGYLAHKVTADTLDEDDVKKKELIDELRHWARRAREHQRNKVLLPN